MYESPYRFLEELEENIFLKGVAHYRDPDFKCKIKEKDYQNLLKQLPNAAYELKRQRKEDLAVTNHYIDVVAGLQIVES